MTSSDERRSDPGMMSVGVDDGVVVISYPGPITSVGIVPEVARELAMSLLCAAHRADEMNAKIKTTGRLQ